MNRAAIRNLTRIWLNETTEGFYLDSELNTLINISNQKLNALITSLKEDFFVVSKTFSTTANSKSYSWPSDFGGLRRLEHYSTSDASDIEKIDMFEWPRTEAGGEWPFGQTGKPRRYIPFGDRYDLWPIPDSAYTLRIYYEAVKSDLSLDTDSPSSPAQFHYLIAVDTAILASSKNHENATDLKAIWDRGEEQLISYITVLKGDDPETVEAYLEGIY